MGRTRVRPTLKWSMWKGSMCVFVCFCPCLSPGGSCLTKRSPELQDQPPAKRVDSFSLTGSEGRVEAVGFSSCKCDTIWSNVSMVCGVCSQWLPCNSACFKQWSTTCKWCMGSGVCCSVNAEVVIAIVQCTQSWKCSPARGVEFVLSKSINCLNQQNYLSSLWPDTDVYPTYE